MIEGDFIGVNFMEGFDFSILDHYDAHGATLPSPDQYVGELIVTDQSIAFHKKQRSCIDYQDSYFSFTEQQAYHEHHLLVILESPHRYEYDDQNKPIGLIMGKSGDNFFSLFASTLEKSDIKLVNRTYNVILANAVQYQTSCGLNPLNRTIRDANWHDIFDRYGGKEDLKKRIFAIKPRFTINLCTGGRHPDGIREKINQTLMSFGLKKGKHFTDGNHPAAWSYHGDIQHAKIN